MGRTLRGPDLSHPARGYDLLADEYATRIFDELEKKPFDCAFLDRLASRLRPGDRVLDLGCGPGHVGRYLGLRGLEVHGVDISERMVDVARRLNPSLTFAQGDMRRLDLRDASAAAALAFYSIIHFSARELVDIFREIRRVLKPGGLLALAFHVGNEVRHVDELWGIKASLDFTFFEPAPVQDALVSAGYLMLESLEREPYDQAVEAQTRRCYIVAQRPLD